MEVMITLVGGLLLLALGGELLVRGAVSIAERFGVSPLLIGLTLVGFGTSMPELVTSVQAALAGSPGIAVGNIVGSNIANILLILGLSAIIFPVAVQKNALKRDGVLVVATAMLLAGVGFLWQLDRPVGALFIAGLAAYITYAYLQERVRPAAAETAAGLKAEAYEGAHPGAHVTEREPVASATPAGSLLLPAFLLVGGLALVIFGGNLLVGAAVSLARTLGISETVIGLTIVAVGTSMPEFITSVIAAIRRQGDVALGNILGSNIYNILGIGGVTALISPTVVPPEIVRFDNLVMVGISVLLLFLAWTGYRIGRREGALLLAGYVTYVWWIWPA
jgi:cation:H+ antiporter